MATRIQVPEGLYPMGPYRRNQTDPPMPELIRAGTKGEYVLVAPTFEQAANFAAHHSWHKDNWSWEQS